MFALNHCGDFSWSWALSCSWTDQLPGGCSGTLCSGRLRGLAPVSGALPCTLWPPGLPSSQLTLCSVSPPCAQKSLSGRRGCPGLTSHLPGPPPHSLTAQDLKAPLRFCVLFFRLFQTGE